MRPFWRTLGVLLAGCMLTVCGCDKSPSGPIPGSAAENAGVESAPVMDQVSVKPIVPGSVGGGAPAPKWLSEYQCHGDADCANESLGAATVEEAKWLRRNGYPSPVELEELHSSSDTQLERKSKEGSLPAMVVYGQRLMMRGETEKGFDLLIASANRGSVYAYYGVSAVYRNHPGFKDHIDAAAFLRVAYILGDRKAAGQLLKDFPGYGPVDYAVIDRRASSLYKTFAKEKRPSVRP